jgi:hypothetical protein
MSDGNFNRALLPKNELGAGLRAGKAQMRQKASEAFDTIINEYFSDTADEKRKEMKQRFMDMLR